MIQRICLPLLLLFLSFSFISYGQSSDLSKKITVLEKQLTTLRDTAKVNRLNELSVYYRVFDTEKALSLARQALTMADSLSYTRGRVISLNNMGAAQAGLQQTDEALNNHRKALAIAQRYHDLTGQANSLMHIGQTLRLQSQYQEAEKCIQRALKISAKTRQPIADKLMAYGYILYDRAEYARAFIYFLKAEEAAKRAADKDLQLRSIMGMGNIYIDIGDYQAALSRFKKALVLKNQVSNSPSVGIMYGIAGAYFGNRDYKTALKYYTIAYQNSVKTKSVAGQVSSLTCMGDSYLELKQYQKAQQAYFGALAKNSSERKLLPIQVGLSHVYRELGDINKALRYAHEALKLASQQQRPYFMTEAYLALSKTYAARKEYDKAYQYHVQYTQDSILNYKTASRIAILQQRHELAKKQMEINLLRKTNELQRARIEKQETNTYLFTAGLCVLAVMIIVLYQARQVKLRANNALKEKNIELNRVSDELKETQQKLKTALASGLVGTWEYSVGKNEIFLDESACRIFGIPPDSSGLNPEAFTTLILPEDQAKEEELRTKAILNNGEYQLEYRVKRQEDKIAWIFARGKAEYHDNGSLKSFSGVMVDITEKKELERHKDEFLSIASHELRTPLSSIKGYIQLAKHALEPKDEAYPFVLKSIQQTIRLERLTSDLRDATRITQGKLYYVVEEFDFTIMLKELVENMQLSVTTHQILIKDTLSIINYTGDRYRIEQVINNFLSNAIKYSPNANVILISLSVVNEEIVVAVQDFGIGIEEEYLHRLNERFYRVRSSLQQFEGLGLGLYISSEILKYHGGRHWVKSEPGKGSIFYFSLPLVHEHQNIMDIDVNAIGRAE